MRVAARQAIRRLGFATSYGIGVGHIDSLQEGPLQPLAPLLTRHDVPGRRVELVADPFLLATETPGLSVILFEAYDRRLRRGVICSASWRHADNRVSFERTALEEPFHLSYPCTVSSGGAYYMTPETNEAEAIRLYAAGSPYGPYEFVRELAHGARFLDPTLVKQPAGWLLFASVPHGGASGLIVLATDDDDLATCRFEPLTGSPYPSGPSQAYGRPAGRAVLLDGTVYRPVQIVQPTYGYGMQMNVGQVVDGRYSEQPGRVLAAGYTAPWARRGAHHVDWRDEPGGVVIHDGLARRLAYVGPVPRRLRSGR